MSSYLVELTIIGDSIGEDEISRRLGLEATRVFKKGDPKSPRSVWKHSVWSLEVLPEKGKEWPSLEEGLLCLLERLKSAKVSLKQIAAEQDVAISCGHFYSTFGGGPTLSPKILQLLADFGLKFCISNYWSDVTSDEVDCAKRGAKRNSRT